MSLFEERLGEALSGGVKRKGNSTRKIRVDARKQAKKTSGGATEVMAKVTGFSKGSSHAKSNLEYISRNGDVELENERGETIKGRQELKAFAKEWVQDFGDSKRHKNQRDTMHLVMSMPPGTDPEAVRRASREFAKQTFAKNHEYVMALHQDTKSPHCHITVKCLGHDGKRLNPRKADLQTWRERFAAEMEREGYMADATPRRARGVVKKPKRQELIHIEQRGVSKVGAAQVKEVAAELAAEAQGKPIPQKPWDTAIKKTQAVVRGAWLAAAIELQTKNLHTSPAHKEYPNERPNYRQSNERLVLEGRRRSPVPKPGDINAGGSVPTETIAGLRNLSAIGMVQDRRPAEMLLRSNARNRVVRGNDRAGDIALRRSGDSLDPAKGTDGKGNAGRVTDKELAEQIRGFVASMPPVETKRDQLKRDLAERFTRAPEIQQPAPQHAPKAPDAPKPQEQARDLGQQNDKDIER